MDQALVKAPTLAPTRSEVARPTTWDELMSISEAMARSGLVPHALRGKPYDVALVIARGSSWGLTWAEALHHLYVVNGKIGVEAELQRQRIMSHPETEEFSILEWSDHTCRIRAKRRGGGALEVEYTIEDARRAGLIRPESAWQKSPADMLLARATGRVKRALFPNILADSPEDLEALVDSTGVNTVEAAAEADTDGVIDAIDSTLEPQPEETEPEEEEPEEEEPEEEDDPDFVRALLRVPRVGRKVANAVFQSGARGASDVMELGEEGLLALPGVGPKATEALLDWAEEATSPPAEGDEEEATLTDGKVQSIRAVFDRMEEERGSEAADAAMRRLGQEVQRRWGVRKLSEVPDRHYNDVLGLIKDLFDWMR